MKLKQKETRYQKRRKTIQVKYESVPDENHDEEVSQVYNLIFEELEKLISKKLDSYSSVNTSYEKSQTIRIS